MSYYAIYCSVCARQLAMGNQAQLVAMALRAIEHLDLHDAALVEFAMPRPGGAGEERAPLLQVVHCR